MFKVMLYAEPGDTHYSPIRSESKYLRAVPTKVLANAIINSLAGEMLVWKEEYLTDKTAAKTAVDLTKIEVPIYALYGDATTVCPADVNKEQLDKSGQVKRSITYEGENTSTFWKSPEKTSVDMVTILGSGAHALVAATVALTLLSTV